MHRLQLLVLSGPDRLYLETFAEKYLKKGRGVLIVGHVVIDDLDDLTNSSIETSFVVNMLSIIAFSLLFHCGEITEKLDGS
jgi:hypothetical protein